MQVAQIIERLPNTTKRPGGRKMCRIVYDVARTLVRCSRRCSIPGTMIGRKNFANLIQSGRVSCKMCLAATQHNAPSVQ